MSSAVRAYCIIRTMSARYSHLCELRTRRLATHRRCKFVVHTPRPLIVGDDALALFYRGDNAVRVGSARLLVIFTLELAMRSREQTGMSQQRRFIGVNGRVKTPMLFGEAWR
jgi:hypothetical protein